MSPKALRLSAALYWATTAALAALPVVIALPLWLSGPRALATALPGLAVPASLPAPLLAAGIAAGLLPALAVAYVLWQMRGLFDFYRRGASLGHGAARQIRRIGAGLLATAALALAARTLQALALTAANPPGERILAFHIASSDVGFLLSGGLMLVIGAVMADAARIAEDNAGFV
ncbi:DUF2975 domain-containing protein [Ovoidimarina sediminis]|uniref:DUF2975 domain-containing protein n=1 Tax=Ovoidimarina sediminis TaxID=3079856 RepID=UPI00292E0C59|nr:DUF2975 domain-containing protein [Rhodophyticola sp. MJ-SS7]